MKCKYSVRKKIGVEYAHQLYTSYTNLCHETIHGHSGVIELTLGADSLNDDQMVIDFGEISSTIKKNLMEKYDHALFMPKQFAPEYLSTLEKFNERLTITDDNPTCERFAEMIYHEVKEQLQMINPKIKLLNVRFHETETGYADYSED